MCNIYVLMVIWNESNTQLLETKYLSFAFVVRYDYFLASLWDYVMSGFGGIFVSGLYRDLTTSIFWMFSFYYYLYRWMDSLSPSTCNLSILLIKFQLCMCSFSARGTLFDPSKHDQHKIHHWKSCWQPKIFTCIDWTE